MQGKRVRELDFTGLEKHASSKLLLLGYHSFPAFLGKLSCHAPAV